MLENIDARGVFFIPGETDKMVPGEIIFEKENGIYLQLDGSLYLPEADIILGQNNFGERFTLYKCKCATNYMLNEHTSWDIQFLIEHEHFEKVEDIKFDCINVSYKNLEEWVNVSGLKKLKSKGKSKYEFKMPKRISFDIDEKVKGNFVFSFRGPSKKFRFDLIQNSHFLIEPKEGELSLEQSLFYINQFNNFLTLGLQEASYPTLIRLSSKKRVTRMGSKDIPDYCYLSYATTIQSDNFKRLLSPLFLFPDIKKEFRKISTFN